MDTFENYRPLLFSIAYRMLGSVMEAEDMVQETYVRYSRMTGESIQSLKAFLCTTVTRLCLDQLKSARAQREQYVGMWLPEPILTAPSPGEVVGEHDSLSMAFLVLLESLSPIERAVFLLREVFDYPYEEIAQMVNRTEATCRQHYRRAKQYILERRPRFDPTPEENRRLVEGFLQAVAAGDMETLNQILAEDVTVYADGGGKAPAARSPIVGREAVAHLYLTSIRKLTYPEAVSFSLEEINNAPAVVVRGETQVFGVLTFTVIDGKIREIRNMFNPDKLKHLWTVLNKEG